MHQRAVNGSSLIAENIHLGLSKLARTDALGEEEVEFGKGAAGGFGDAEVDVDDAEEADAGPEETGEVGPVPGAGVEHVRGEDGSDDANNDAASC